MYLKKIEKMSKKENKIIDSKKEFCYINTQVIKTLKP